MDTQAIEVMRSVTAHVEEILGQSTFPPLPALADIRRAEACLIRNIPSQGHGLQRTSEHLRSHVLPGLNCSSLSSGYYGFVTGGVTPAARIADSLTTLYDQNVAVHLPEETIATVVEGRALFLTLELLGFKPSEWPSRTLNTGATASNILGLACGRHFTITQSLRRLGQESSDGEGILSACRRAGIEDFQVLSTLPHSSLAKAANLVGLGSTCVVDISRDDGTIRFDMAKLEQYLSKTKLASIVVISCGEVNTGAFATGSFEDVEAIRQLCDTHGAWLHVDGGKFCHFLCSFQPTEHSTASQSSLTEL